MDPLRSRPWPQGTLEALDQIRQGHVFDGVPLIAVGPASVDKALWLAVHAGADVAGLAVLAEDPPGSRRVMVVSQGCDIVKPAFPCLTVVPVYDARYLGPSQQSSAKSGRTKHLIALDAAWAADGFWVADLRFEMSVDKALIAGLVPLEAFANEVGYGELAQRLGDARQRAAVPEPCLDHVVKPLFRACTRPAGK